MCVKLERSMMMLQDSFALGCYTVFSSHIEPDDIMFDGDSTWASLLFLEYFGDVDRDPEEVICSNEHKDRFWGCVTFVSFRPLGFNESRLLVVMVKLFIGFILTAFEAPALVLLMNYLSWLSN